MSDIRIDSEKELIEEVLKSKVYKEFTQKRLQSKIERERRGWKLLIQHRGKYTHDILNQIFDTLDLYEGKKRWFGALLATPNRNLIFEAELKEINQWFEELLFSGADPNTALDICLGKNRIKGASKGLATLLLYLSNPEKHNIWVNATQQGLYILNRIGDLKGKEWGENYLLFNEASIEFREAYGLPQQAVDWFLSFLSSYVAVEDNHFRVSEDILDTSEVLVTIDDDSDIEDVVGEPMELGVMRWTPTNEMGVVALFIEFRKELGFPIIEVIRTNFPDAAVFEEASKGYVRKYIEFEFRSSGYRSHLKSKRKCHYVVCWEHDWKDCPIPVIELKNQIPNILLQTKAKK
jgi:hypothetical protein